MFLGRKALNRLVVSASDYSREAGVTAMRRLAASPDLDAVFVASDLLASGALVELRRSGRRVPDDVAVGGFDDSRIARESDPPLTTIRQPLEQVAREMVDILLRLIRHEEVSSLSCRRSSSFASPHEPARDPGWSYEASRDQRGS
jgi:DNA-binding LacI/PurR family transcriptional regulator